MNHNCFDVYLNGQPVRGSLIRQLLALCNSKRKISQNSRQIMKDYLFQGFAIVSFFFSGRVVCLREFTWIRSLSLSFGFKFRRVTRLYICSSLSVTWIRGLLEHPLEITTLLPVSDPSTASYFYWVMVNILVDLFYCYLGFLGFSFGRGLSS